jgi:hypothetical protein
LSIAAIEGISTDHIQALTVEQGNAFIQAQIDVMTSDQSTALIAVITS